MKTPFQRKTFKNSFLLMFLVAALLLNSCVSNDDFSKKLECNKLQASTEAEYADLENYLVGKVFYSPSLDTCVNTMTILPRDYDPDVVTIIRFTDILSDTVIESFDGNEYEDGYEFAEDWKGKREALMGN